MILIIGNGYMGKIFHAYFADSVIYPKKINSLADAYLAIDTYHPHILINCAGATGKPNVDWCESNKEYTLMANVMLPLWLATVAQKRNIYMLHLGSGCVYDGDNSGKGFTEEDEPNFTGSFYSLTKMISEKILKDFNVLQLRIRMPIDSEGSDRSLITKLVKYKTIINCRNSVTIVDDLLKVADHLIKNNKTGIYNVVNPSPMTHSEIMDLYKEIVDPSFVYKLITLEELKSITVAKRSNCVLNTDKLSKEIKLKPLNKRIREIL